MSGTVLKMSSISRLQYFSERCVVRVNKNTTFADLFKEHDGKS